MSHRLITIKKSVLELGSEIGRGGEGIVYRLGNHADLAVKLYHPGRMTAEHRRKLEVMVELANPQLVQHSAWPVDLIETGNFGVVMPLVDRTIEIHDAYGPKSRMTKLPEAGFKFLLLVSYNLAVAVKHIHAAGVVVGDFNQRNILVTKDARVRFVDCDSFQIRRGNELFRCLVGTPDQLAPEVHNRPLDHIIREPDQDNFTLAVVIFQLLFLGRHPFAGVGGPDELPQAIQRHLYAYGGQGAKGGIRPPPHAPPLDLLPPNIIRLFEQAFAPPNMRVSRPTPDDWIRELKYCVEHVVQCRTVSIHEFVAGRMKCPWCDLENRFQLVFFVSTAPIISAPGLGSFPELTQQLLRVGAPTWLGRTTARPAVTATAVPVVSTAWPGSFWFGMLILAAAGVALATGHWILAILIGGWGVQTALSGLPAEHPQVAAAKKAVAERKHAKDQIEREAQQFAGGLAQAFVERQRRVHALRSKYDGLGAERTRRHGELRSQHLQLQLEQYLDQFYIARASISGFGSRRKDALLSYGIETAKDVRSGMGVTGVGPDLEARLLAWRASHEQAFRFSPAMPIDPREFQKIDAALSNEKQDLERKLLGLKDEIEQAARKAAAELRARSKLFEFEDDAMAQSEADLAAATPIGAQNPGSAPKLALACWILLLVFGAAFYAGSSKTAPSYPAPSLATAPTPVPLTGKLAIISGAPATVELYRNNQGQLTLLQTLSVSSAKYEASDLAVGTYRLIAQALGWKEPKHFDVVVGTGQVQQVEIPFERTKMKFDSVPRGAEVWDMNEMLGKTPLEVSDVSVEKHTYSFRYDRLPNRTIEVELTRDFHTLMQVWPLGTITVVSDPSGADVWQSDRLMGRTPLTLPQLLPGDYIFRVSLDNFQTQQIRGKISSDESIELTALMVDSRPVKMTAKVKGTNDALTIVNQSDRSARIQKIWVRRPTGDVLVELSPQTSIGPGENLLFSLPREIAADSLIEIACDRASVELTVERPDPAQTTAAAAVFLPRSVLVSLDRRSQILRINNTGKTSFTIRTIELEYRSDARKPSVKVSRKLDHGQSLRVQLPTRASDDYTFRIVTEPELPTGTISFTQ